MRKMLSIIVVLALLISSTAIAAPAEKTKETGRTELAKTTGVITPAALAKTDFVHMESSQLELQGTVVIDGPQLVFNVSLPGAIVSPVSIAKIGDKTWTYSVIVDPSPLRGSATISYSAYTIYANGANVGKIHTSAPEETQEIHVAYVTDFEYSDFSWDGYDRDTNLFSYSYNLIKIWSNGKRELVNEPVTGTVLGTGVVTIIGDDPTYDGRPKDLGVECPPARVREFKYSFTWGTYDRVENEYSYSYTVTKIWSNDAQTSDGPETGTVSGTGSVEITGSDETYDGGLSVALGTECPPVKVRRFEYSDFSWGAYDREQNLYPYSYTLTKVWSNGDESSDDVTETVSGTGSVEITASDETYDGGLSVTLATITPPVNVRSFAVSGATWTYNETTRKYDLAFTLTTNLSNGQVATEVVSRNGIAPSSTHTYAASGLGYSQYFLFTAPAAPAPQVPVVDYARVSNPNYYYAGKSDNVKVDYTLCYSINGVEFSTLKDFNFSNDNSDRSLTHPAPFNGQTVTISYTLPFKWPGASTDPVEPPLPPAE